MLMIVSSVEQASQLSHRLEYLRSLAQKLSVVCVARPGWWLKQTPKSADQKYYAMQVPLHFGISVDHGSGPRQL